MRFFICFSFLFIGQYASAFGEVVTDERIHLSAFGYHARVGVPKADAVLRSESVVGRIVGGSQTGTADAYPYQFSRALRSQGDLPAAAYNQVAGNLWTAGKSVQYEPVPKDPTPDEGVRLHLLAEAGIIVTLTTGWTSVCGGSLLSSTRVLTAAHCWWDGQNRARTFTIVLGSLTLFSGGTRVDTADVIVHASWNPNDIMFDVAMARIASVSFNNNIQAIPLPSTADVNTDFAGVPAVTSGYGKTSDAQNSFPTTTSLYHVNLQVITNTVCQRSFDVSIHGSHLCTNGASGVGTCDGDSGGPLAAVRNNQRILIGVTSFGIGDRCQGSYPSVFSRVTAYLSWIQGQM